MNRERDRKAGDAGGCLKAIMKITFVPLPRFSSVSFFCNKLDRDCV